MLNRYDPIDVVNVAAGDAADATTNYYVDVKGYDRFPLQVNFTASTGTISIKIYGTMLSFTDPAAAKVGDSGDAYHDVTQAYAGVAAITGDYMILDDARILAGMAFLKFAVTVASTEQDETVAYQIRLTKAGD